MKFILEAKRCFEYSLSRKKNQKALQSLSMILRAMPAKAEKQRNENIELSLERAEEAVQIGKKFFVLSRVT